MRYVVFTKQVDTWYHEDALNFRQVADVGSHIAGSLTTQVVLCQRDGVFPKSDHCLLHRRAAVPGLRMDKMICVFHGKSEQFTLNPKP